MTHMRLRVGQMKQQNLAGLILSASYTLRPRSFCELQQVNLLSEGHTFCKVLSINDKIMSKIYIYLALQKPEPVSSKLT